jgi:hypothetical protein
MEFTKILANRSKSAVAVFHKYRLEVVVNRDRKYIFVEGYDDLFFYREVGRRIGLTNADFRVAFGKKNLDRIIQWFHDEGFAWSDTLFIRDRDYDELFGRLPDYPNLLVTVGYSVENYVCQPDNIAAVVVQSFGVDPLEIDVTAEVRYFSNQLAMLSGEMHDYLYELFSCLESEVNIDLNSVSFRSMGVQLLEGDLTEVRTFLLDCCLSFRDLRGGFTTTVRADLYALNDPFVCMRGKHLLELVCEFLGFVRRKLVALDELGRLSIFNKRGMASIEMNAVFERLALSAETPKDIEAALSRSWAAAE